MDNCQKNTLDVKTNINKKSRSYKALAFTLAEVLIVIGIIGIIAQITIPSLIGGIQKQQYIDGVEKFYSNFNQVLTKYSADNGCTGDLQCTGVFNGDSGAVGAAFAPYLKVAKNCGTSTGCFAGNISYNIDGSGPRYNNYRDTAGPFYKFVTADGMNVLLVSFSSNCEDGNSTGVTNNMQQFCGYIIVDVNGDKSPNNLGRDIFGFSITNGRGPILYPQGGSDDGDNCPWNDPDCTGSIEAPTSWNCSAKNPLGGQCAGRVIEEGWRMTY